VRAQTNQHFRWVLAAHPKTPSSFLEQALAAATNAILLLVEGNQVFFSWPRYIKGLIQSGKLLTTRLDSDDMIHSRFVETVQHQAAKMQRPHVIDFPNGFMLRHPDMALSAFTSRQPTHFISLLEDGHETVNCCDHTTIGQRFPVLRLQTEPYWVEICHHNNMDNIYRHSGRSAKWNVLKSSFIGSSTTVPVRSAYPMEKRKMLSTKTHQARHRLETTLVCPICRVTSNRFLDFGLTPRKNAMCPVCRSLERHRLLWLFLKRNTDLFGGRAKRLLHLAPEFCLAHRLRKLTSVNYLSADLNDKRAMAPMDVTNIQYQDSVFDVILCNHVLEHIPNDRLAMRELRRVLARSGWAVFMVPIYSPATFEDSRITDPKRRELLFGQHDHVRRYGPDFEQRLKDSGFKVRVIHSFDVVSASECKQFAISPRERIYLAIK
jgi:SAM-dependent methyltransferase